MDDEYRILTDFFAALGSDAVAHTGRSYLAHVVGVYHLMRRAGCSPELCRAGMFHSIYGTEKFQAFSLPLERRGDVRSLIGDRAERLAYLNCVMDRASLDAALDLDPGPYPLRERTGSVHSLDRVDYDDLCRVHLFDWLEQVPRSRYGWDYRRSAYRRIAERLGGVALSEYNRVFAAEPATVEGANS